MGQLATKLYRKNKKILVLGHGSSGKTTILKILENKYCGTRHSLHVCNPTQGFDVKVIEKMNFWDLSGKPAIKSFWKCYYHSTDGVMYVMDCCNEGSYENSIEDISRILADAELKDAVFLVIFNVKRQLDKEELDEIKKSVIKLFSSKNVICCENTMDDFSSLFSSVEKFLQRVHIR